MEWLIDIWELIEWLVNSSQLFHSSFNQTAFSFFTAAISQQLFHSCHSFFTAHG
jgi:hypothetical protein